MRKIILLTFATITLTFLSCDLNDENDGKFNADPSSGSIEFLKDTIIGTGSKNINIPVSLISSTNSNNLGVTYSVEAVEGDVPTNVLGTFTQAKVVSEDNLSGNISINTQAPNSGDCYLIKVTMISTSRENVVVNLDENKSNEAFIEISSIASSYSGVTYFQGVPRENFTANLSPIEGELDSYRINTAWGEGLVEEVNGDSEAVAPYEGILIINSDGSVSIKGDAIYATGGTGVFNPCQGIITYTLTQAYFPNQDLTFDVILTQN